MSSSTPQISPQELINAIVAADGNLAVTSERLAFQGITLSEQDIITAVSNTDQASLGEVLRTGAVVMLYHSLSKTQKALLQKLDRMPVADLGRMHAAQMQALANLTSRPTEDATEQPVSIEAIRGQMLERVRQAEERERQASGS